MSEGGSNYNAANAAVTGPRVTLYGRGTQITISVFAGQPYLKVSQNQKMVFNHKLSMEGLEIIRKALILLKDATPGSSQGICVNQYNRETKKSERLFVIKLIKSDALVYGMEITDRGGATYAAPLLTSTNYTTSTDAPNDRDRSAEALDSLIHRLHIEFPIGMMMTAMGRTSGGGRPGGSGGQGGGAPGGNAPSAPADNGSGWDDQPPAAF